MKKLNEQNTQFTHSTTPESLSLIEQDQETERCREEKDDTQSSAAEEEPGREETVAELLQAKEDEPPEEKTQDLSEIQQTSQNSFSQNDKRITVTQDT